MGGKTNTSTSQQTSTPVNQAALQNIYNTVSGAASTPYTPYGGELNAGINAQQTSGINTINGASNFASPYIQSAGALAQGAANPLTSAQIQQYQNPYIQNVVDATQAQFNDQNGQAQNALKGNAASQGALGGDRQAVAQTTLAKNQQIAQAPTIANLYSNSYNSGLQTAAQQYQQNPLAAASSLAGIGTAGQTAALQGGQAQIAAGTLQQQTQQGADTAAYQQYLQAQGMPYAQAAFLQQYGLPTALAQGTTSSGTQTTPGPNPLTQALGLGTAALTAFSDERVKENKEEIGKTYDGQPIYRFNYIGSPMTQIGLMAQNVEHSHPDAVGESGGIKTVDYGKATEDAAGRGKFASGGAALPFGGVSFIPGGGASNAQLNAPSLSFAKPQDSGGGMDASLGKFIGTAGKSGLFSDPAYGGESALTGTYGGSSSNPLPGLDASDYGPGYSSGGFVDAIHQIHRAVKRASGGAVGNTPFQSYADGGWAMDDRFGAAFPQRDVPAPPPIVAKDDDVVNPGDPIRMPDQPAVDAWRQGVDKTSPAPEVNPAAAPAASPMRAPLPREITNPDNTPPEPTTALAYSGASPMTARPTESAAPESRWGGFNPLGLSDKAREAIITGALGVAASRSPFALSAIGEGGLSGMRQYSASTHAEQEAADKAATRGQEQQRIDLQAKQLTANIDNQKRQEATSGLIPDGKGGYQVNQAYIDLKKAEDEAKSYKPTWGIVRKSVDPDTGQSREEYGWIDPNGKKVTDAQGRPLGDPPAAKPAATNPDGTPLTGKAYLDGISPQRATLAKQIAEYKVNPGGLSVRGGHREQAIADATRYNPDYDQRRFASSNASIKNFDAGTEGRTVRSLNVAIDHLNTLQEAAEALKNGNTPILNRITNAYREKTGSPLTTNFDSIKQVVSAEIAKAVVGGTTALHDRDDMAQRAANSQSHDQLSGIVTQFKKLMAGQMKGLRHTYETSTGLKDFDKYMEPGTKKELESFSGSDAAAAPATPSSKPATVIQSGHTYTLQPDGSYK